MGAVRGLADASALSAPRLSANLSRIPDGRQPLAAPRNFRRPATRSDICHDWGLQCRACEQRGLAHGKRRFVAKEGGGLLGEGARDQRPAACPASSREGPQLPQRRRGDRGAAIERPARCGNAIGGLTSRAIGQAPAKLASALIITAHLMRFFALAKPPIHSLNSLPAWRSQTGSGRVWPFITFRLNMPAQRLAARGCSLFDPLTRAACPRPR
jgi:hypothetical protein